MSDIWTRLASDPDALPSEGGGDFQDLPDKVWCIGVNATNSNGGAAPKASSFTGDDGAEVQKFEVGLICQGGSDDLDEKFNGFMAFFNCYIRPNPEKEKDKVISGRFMHFINTILSPGVGGPGGEKGDSKEVRERKEKARVVERWRNSLKVLQEAASLRGITAEQFPGPKGQPDDPMFIRACLIEALGMDAKPILFRVRHRPWKSKSTGAAGVNIEASAVADAIPEEKAKRNVELFEKRGVEGAGSISY